MSIKCGNALCDNQLPKDPRGQVSRSFCSSKCQRDHRARFIWAATADERLRSTLKVFNYRDVPEPKDDPEFDWSVEMDSAYFAYLRANSIVGNQPVTESCWRRTIYEQ